jgi:TP901 family phage tail tape measure protein
MANSEVVGLLRVLLTADTAEFDSAMKKVGGAASQFEKDFKKIGQQATQVGAALTRTLTVPLVGLGAGALKLAADFESSFAGVRKTVDATEPEFAQMAQAFRNLSKEIPVNVNELARLGEAAGALDIPKENIVDFARVMAMLGVTTNVTSDQAATAIAKIQTQFRAAGKETENFASTLVHLGNNGASTEAEILELAERLASAGQAAGLSQPQVLGFAAAMANVGINAEAGGTALSRTFNEINVAVATGSEELAGFARVAKMSTTQFAEAFRKDAAGAMEAFIKGLGQVEAEGGNLIVTLEELGIKEIRQSDTLRRLALNTDNVTKSLQDANTGWTQNTALVTEARERFKTTESQLKLLWQRIQDVGITLGNALLPALNSAIRVMDGFIPMVDAAAKGFAAMPTPIQATAIAIAGLTAAAGPAIWGLGQLALASSAIGGAFKEGAIGAIALKNGIAAIAFVTSPIGIAITAIGTLAAAWASFTGDWTRAFDVLIPPLGFFRAAIDEGRRAIEPYRQTISDLATVVKGLFVDAWESASAVMARFQNTVMSELMARTEGLRNAITTLANAIINSLPAAFDVARAALERFLPGLSLLLAAEGKLRSWATGGKQSLHEMAEGYRETEAAHTSLMNKTATNFFSGFSASAGAAKTEAGQLGGVLGGLNATLGATSSATTSASASLDGASKSAKKAADDFHIIWGELDNITRFQIAGILNPQLTSFETHTENATEALQELRYELERVGGTAIQIGPVLTNTMKLPWVTLKGTVQEVKPQIDGFFTKVFGGAESFGTGISSIFQSAFVGGGGALGAVKSFATQTLSTMLGMIPGLGPFLSGFAGPIIAMFSNLAKKAGDLFRKIFGGPSGDELKGREAVKEFEQSLWDTLTAAQELEAGGEDWKKTVIALRDAYIAAGKSEEDALRAAEELWASSRDGAEAAARVIEEIKEAMRKSGDTAVDAVTQIGRAVDGLPDIVGIRVKIIPEGDVDFRPPGEFVGGDPGFSAGTKGRLGSWFGRFPASGMATKLHNVEAVLRPQDAMPFAQDVMQAAGATTNTQSNNVALLVMQPGEALDPSRITREVFKQFKGALSMDTEGMETAIESVVENYMRTYQHG